MRILREKRFTNTALGELIRDQINFLFGFGCCYVCLFRYLPYIKLPVTIQLYVINTNLLARLHSFSFLLCFFLLEKKKFFHFDIVAGLFNRAGAARIEHMYGLSYHSSAQTVFGFFFLIFMFVIYFLFIVSWVTLNL